MPRNWNAECFAQGMEPYVKYTNVYYERTYIENYGQFVVMKWSGYVKTMLANCLLEH